MSIDWPSEPFEKKSRVRKKERKRKLENYYSLSFSSLASGTSSTRVTKNRTLFSFPSPRALTIFFGRFSSSAFFLDLVNWRNCPERNEKKRKILKLNYRDDYDICTVRKTMKVMEQPRSYYRNSDHAERRFTVPNH